jgi:hypothetical protein
VLNARKHLSKFQSFGRKLENGTIPQRCNIFHLTSNSYYNPLTIPWRGYVRCLVEMFDEIRLNFLAIT